MVDPFKYITLFIDTLKNHPWQTLLVLLFFSLLANIYQFLSCSSEVGNHLINYERKTTYEVADSLNQKIFHRVDSLRSVYLPDRPDQFADILESYFTCAIKTNETIRRFGYDKPLSPTEKELLIRSLSKCN